MDFLLNLPQRAFPSDDSIIQNVHKMQNILKYSRNDSTEQHLILSVIKNIRNGKQKSI